MAAAGAKNVAFWSDKEAKMRLATDHGLRDRARVGSLRHVQPEEGSWRRSSPASPIGRIQRAKKSSAHCSIPIALSMTSSVVRARWISVETAVLLEPTRAGSSTNRFEQRRRMKVRRTPNATDTLLQRRGHGPRVVRASVRGWPPFPHRRVGGQSTPGRGRGRLLDPLRLVTATIQFGSGFSCSKDRPRSVRADPRTF